MTWLKDPAHRRWLEAETDRLLEFGRASRHPDGGFALAGTSAVARCWTSRSSCGSPAG